MTRYTVDQPYFYCTWTSSALASSPTSTDRLDLALQRLPRRLLLQMRADTTFIISGTSALASAPTSTDSVPLR